MYNQTAAEGKTLAVVSYLTIIGTIIAFVLNQNKKNYFAAFHIRQALGIFLTALIVNFLLRYSNFDWLDWVLRVGVFVLWIFGLIGAIQGEEKRVPLLGDKFQEWFGSIG